MSEPDRELAERLRSAIGDERVLAALASVPRAAFVPSRLRARAGENRPLEIGCGQTISQPLVVARMCQALAVAPGDRVLDVGTGSGYHAAVLARLGAHVWSVERHPALSRQAARNLAEAGIGNVTLVVGDGTRGLPEVAPFDAINVAAAAAETVPRALVEQLASGGRLIAPVESGIQRLVLVRRTDDEVAFRWLEPVRFVPLVPGDGRGE
jgi:protein-L-isoaspartate(D-aspartate) O-methyltransferase